ncbi:MAG: arylsulfatase [Planctomycetota bacterium]
MMNPLYLATSLAILVSTVPVASAAERPPNFIFVLSDDIAQGDLGCYGQELIQTPRLDQMAAEGTRYLQAYCGTSVCAPSRSSFFTGLHTGHCPVRGNYEIAPQGQLPLPDDTLTIAEIAKSTGYATATFGKWGMGNFDTTGSPFRQGVDRFFGYNCQRHAHSYFPTYLYDDDQAIALPGNDGKEVGEIYAQELIQNAMIQWLRAQAEQPFFLFYAITLPHGRHEIDDLGQYSNQDWTPLQKAYAAQVTRVDRDMGELMDTLRELGIANNTLIVFSGDNGSSHSPSSELGKQFNQARNGLRGYKRGMYEGALRQAALAWWPGTVPAGRVDASPWAFWDLMPTFVSMSGAETPADYHSDGLDLTEYFSGGPAPERGHFYWELHLSQPVQATRFGDWKAVRNGITKPVELYNLADDAGERNDVAAQHPEMVRRALRIFAESHSPDPNWPLDGVSPQHKQDASAAWKLQRERNAAAWVPDDADPDAYRVYSARN